MYLQIEISLMFLPLIFFFINSFGVLFINRSRKDTMILVVDHLWLPMRFPIFFDCLRNSFFGLLCVSIFSSSVR